MPTDPPPDTGFVFSERSRSAEEAVSRSPGGREMQIVKSAIQAYLASFITPGTRRNMLLMQHAPSAANFALDKQGARSVHFNLDHRWDQPYDPVKKRVQIARIIEEIYQKLPSVIIVDAGHRNRNPGLGHVQGGIFMSGGGVSALSTAAFIDTELVCNLELIIAAKDEVACDDMVSWVRAAFSELRGLAGGDQLSDDEGRWVLTLPMGEVSAGAISRQNIPDDPKDSYYQSSISVELVYQGRSTIYMRQGVRGTATGLGDEGASEAIPSADGQTPDLYLVGATTGVTLAVGETHLLQIAMPDGQTTVRLSDRYLLQLSDTRLARIDPSTRRLIARQRGVVNVRLLDRSMTGDGPDHTSRLVSELAVTIVGRR